MGKRNTWLIESLETTIFCIVNAFDATDATDKLVKDAKTINNKIQGKRAAAKKAKPSTPDSEAAEDKTISVSQQSYDALIDNFGKLIDLVGTEPTYTPNETELQISTLQTNLGNLKVSNTGVVNAYTNYSNSLELQEKSGQKYKSIKLHFLIC